VSDGRLHDGSPHDALTQKALDPRVRSVEVERWVFAAVTCEHSRHANRHAIALHFACQSLDAGGW
jgi:hypothetical protein